MTHIICHVCSHTPAMYKSRSLTSYEIYQCLYVDDGAFLFNSREDMIKGPNLDGGGLAVVSAAMKMPAVAELEAKIAELEALVKVSV